MITTADIFGQQAPLDFSSGKVDTADLFNSGIVPIMNNLLVSAGIDLPEEDNSIRDRQRNLLKRNENVSNALNQVEQSSSTLGFSHDGLSLDPSAFSTRRDTRGYRENDFGIDDKYTISPAKSPSSTDPANFTFEREAQRDGKGRLRVYKPPKGDGGGRFEIAGITQRYHPKVATRLRSLIREGKHEQAESEAKEFYTKRGRPFTTKTDNKGLQLQLSDTVHHRGEGGLRTILQRATGSSSRNYGSLIKQLSDSKTPLASFNNARTGYERDNIDRGRASRKKFRKGLANRFRLANKAAIQANSTN